MSKLWIVHRNPQQQVALARVSGLPESEIRHGAPGESDFLGLPAPAALLLHLEGDFELELDFMQRHRERLAHSRCLLIVDPADADEARRLFQAVRPEIHQGPPSTRILRGFISSAISHRNAASLAERQRRQRISERFGIWLGGIEVPGLLRALDPALAQLPFLVRGVPGSGRTLLCHYVEIFRAMAGPTLRLHGRDLHLPETLVQRLIEAARDSAAPPRSIWIDEIDSLSISGQNALAELMTHGAAGSGLDTSNLRWIATAGPSGLGDRLEPVLDHLFAPLQVQIPSLMDHPETLPAFADEVARDWTRSVGGVPREFGDSALTILEAHPWTGDRAELEAVLRTSLAASSRERLEDIDLRFPSDPIRKESADADTSHTNHTTDATRHADPRIDPLGIRQELDPIDALLAVEAVDEGVESLEDLPAAVFDDAPLSPTADSSIADAVFAPAADAETLEADQPTLTNEPASPLEASRPTTPTISTIPTTKTTTTNTTETDPVDSPLDESLLLSEASFDLSKPLVKPTDASDSEANLDWQRLARCLSHEIRNPLVSIRTFSELLPQHFDDETFRQRFTELVGRDVAHIADVLSRLSSVADRDSFAAEAVDVSNLIESLLEERRERIATGRLLVLRELERDAPLAWADAQGLEVALAGLLDRALESLPERGDLFVATRHLERAADGKPKLRILLRHHNPTPTPTPTHGHSRGIDSGGLPELDPTANVLEYVLAETIVKSAGGSLTIDASDAQETLILVDLQTPN